MTQLLRQRKVERAIGIGFKDRGDRAHYREATVRIAGGKIL